MLERDGESQLDPTPNRLFYNYLGRWLSPDPLLNSGRPLDPQSWNRYTYAHNNPTTLTDPSGLYDLANNCGADNKKCNKQFYRHAKDLKNGLANLQNQLKHVKDPIQKARLAAALKAIGTEGDHNGVNVSFGATKDGSAGETDPVYNGVGAKETYNVTLDPSKIHGSDDYAIDAAHEGTHVDDINTELANPNGTTLSPFSFEYRGYQTSAWAGEAIGVPNLSFQGNMIWNSSWATVDRQTLMDKGITNVMEGPPYNYTETVPHNPWPN